MAFAIGPGLSALRVTAFLSGIANIAFLPVVPLSQVLPEQNNEDYTYFPYSTHFFGSIFLGLPDPDP
jgi:hypothetical protein